MDTLNEIKTPRPVAIVVLVLALAQALNVMTWWARGAEAVAQGASAPTFEVEEPAHDQSAPEYSDEDVLWLARCVYSETKRPYEQELVAWVVRNRVETSYRGKTTYRDVVLEPFQFSAFNADNPKRDFYLSLLERSNARGWQRALQVAREVLQADHGNRPFSEKTRHFYSPWSMLDGRTPLWAEDGEAVEVGGVDPERFRFFAYVV